MFLLCVWNKRLIIIIITVGRCPDDIVVLRWHPTDPATLLAGLTNGQICIWDMEDWIEVNNKYLFIYRHI